MTRSRFLDRWLRLKQAAEKARQAGEVLPVGPDAQRLAEGMLADLSPDSDFRAFLSEEVSEAVRRQAMKTLFADPRFNVIDLLDVYVDDYSISEPIPADMLATLNQAKSLWKTEEATTVADAATQDCAEAASGPVCAPLESDDMDIVRADSPAKIPETNRERGESPS